MKKLFRTFPSLERFKFDFENFKKALPYHTQNCLNRGSSCSPQLIYDTWTAYTQKVKDLAMLEDRSLKYRQKYDIFSVPTVTSDLAVYKKHTRLLHQDIRHLKAELSRLETALIERTWNLPNRTAPEVPTSTEPLVLSEVAGLPVQANCLDHLALGKKFNLFNFEAGSSVAGSKFVYLQNEAALLELALINWTLRKMAQKGYKPVLTPNIAQANTVLACGFNPRDEAEQLYVLKNQTHCLIGTSEITLAGLHTNKEYFATDLPLKYVGFSHCFRMEAGRGTTAKGLFRLHQFSKVEMFICCAPEDSELVHREVVSLQEEILQELGLGYRVLMMPTSDLGASAYKKIDIEAFIPSRGYVEVSSASNCTDYQAIRMNALYEGQPLHTVNGTALAVPRIIMGLLEIGQRKDSIVVPECLTDFLGFTEIALSKL